MKNLIPLLSILLLGCTTSRLPDTLNEEYARLSAIYLLDTDVDAVVRDYQMNLQVIDESQGLLNVKKVVSVLNKDARGQGFLVIGYDRFREIVNVEAALYDKNGKYIRSLQNDDVKDYSATSSYSLYEDNRARTYQLYHNQYPYTIVYDYSIKLSSLLNMPTWLPQDENEYVEKASLVVESPQELKVRHKAFNLESPPGKSNGNGNSILKWEVENLPPVEREPLAPPFKELVPKVMIAVNGFSMEGIYGSMDSWNSFGKWYYDLSRGRNALPLSVQQQVRNIFNNASTRKEGIKHLYEYMQQKTRYVSVQLGIGGWRPFEAAYVEEKGYGDCKALTNYMKSLLDYAGVASYPVLIKNGISEADIIADFPSNQFNHVVLYVPIDEGEGIWLESTNQFMPFNHIGFSNANRQGLVVKKDTAYLIDTPSYDYTVNKQNTKTEIRLDTDGNADLKVENMVSGFYLDRVMAELANKSELDRQKWLYLSIPLNTFENQSADFTEIVQKKREPVIEYQLKSKAYGTKTGSRLFVPVNELNKWTSPLLKSDKQRKQKILLKASFSEFDETTIHIPDNYKIETIPQQVELNFGFAEYSLYVEPLVKLNQVKVERLLTIYESELSADKFSDLEEFTSRVIASDQQNLILTQL